MLNQRVRGRVIHQLYTSHTTKTGPVWTRPRDRGLFWLLLPDATQMQSGNRPRQPHAQCPNGQLPESTDKQIAEPSSQQVIRTSATAVQLWFTSVLDTPEKTIKRRKQVWELKWTGGTWCDVFDWCTQVTSIKKFFCGSCWCFFCQHAHWLASQ